MHNYKSFSFKHNYIAQLIEIMFTIYDIKYIGDEYNINLFMCF